MDGGKRHLDREVGKSLCCDTSDASGFDDESLKKQVGPEPSPALVITESAKKNSMFLTAAVLLNTSSQQISPLYSFRVTNGSSVISSSDQLKALLLDVCGQSKANYISPHSRPISSRSKNKDDTQTTK